MKRGELGLLIFALVGLFYDLSLARTLTVTAPSRIVRAGPGKTYTIVGKVAKTEQYEVMQEQGGWYKIQLAGSNTGWVSGEGVALDQISPLPYLELQSRGYGNASYAASKVVLRYAPPPHLSLTLGYRVQVISEAITAAGFDSGHAIDLTHGPIIGVNYRF